MQYLKSLNYPQLINTKLRFTTLYFTKLYFTTL
nr:MAG TPA: hypothetical protein [Caudoviricetes sp.]